ncbi:MAG: protein-export chaperone SecB [Wolbachia sp.]|nr:protein-export chaperone SecB [Wolbachia sp.]MDD9335819.1 protein-export chaperone SecB [Wolbachia sp.]
MQQQKMRIHGQYIKDLSFENPNSPFLASNKAPDINVMVNINSVRLEGKEGGSKEKSFHEITLHVEIKATIQDTEKIKTASQTNDSKENIAFVCEIKYCGIFSMENSQTLDEELKKWLFVDAPIFLFPFAREIIARITSSSGFPPLMLDPIDFETMYEQQSRQ